MCPKGFAYFLGEEPSLYMLCAKSKHSKRQGGKRGGFAGRGEGVMEVGKGLKNLHVLLNTLSEQELPLQ